MNDIDGNIIKKQLNNPPEFEFNEKPWIIVKSRLTYDRKLRKVGAFALLSGILLLGLMAIVGNYWYNKKLQIYKNTTNTVDNIRKNRHEIIFNTDTIYKEKIIYIHDTLYKTIKIVKPISPIPTENNIVSLNMHKLNNYKSIFSIGRNNFFNNFNYKIGGLPLTLGFTNNSNRIQNNSIPYYREQNKQSRLNEIERLMFKLNLIKYKRNIGYGQNYQYNKWLNELASKVAKEKRTLKYKMSKFLSGFNEVGYEIEPKIGGVYSLVFKKSNIGLLTGLNSKVLFENGIKAAIGVNWIDYHGEFKAVDIVDGDFPKTPNNGDIFDGIYFDNSYWLLPLGLEYHFNYQKTFHPYIGIGWAMKFGIKDIIKYEFHDIKTYKEYKINKTFDESFDYSNYFLKTGIEYNWNKNYSNSLEFSYYFSNKTYKYNYSKLNNLFLTLNVKYRF